jgi:hypothetical protein
VLTSVALNEIVVVPKIHETNTHSTYWNQLKAQPSIKMSIDLFHYGLLVYRNEFKEKQHFVLKHC